MPETLEGAGKGRKEGAPHGVVVREKEETRKETLWKMTR